jgi:DNA invertase Pin-like site-specific DNA recombinase
MKAIGYVRVAIGYVRVSTDRQAEHGVSLEAQEAKIRAMATVQGAEMFEVIVDGGESAKNLNRPGLQRLLALVDRGKVDAVIVAKLDGLTRSVKDLCSLLELFEKRGVALISVAESLDTASAAGRLVITIMAAVSQWEREAIGERTRDALRHKRTSGERVNKQDMASPLGGIVKRRERPISLQQITRSDRAFDPERSGGSDSFLLTRHP